MENARILEKVKALLAKTTENGATDAEAQSAFLKAQELLAKHGLSMEDAESLKQQKEAIKQANGRTRGNKKYRVPLCNAVAKAFRCEVFLQNFGFDTVVMFLGRETDVAVCREVFNSAYEFISKESDRQYEKAYAETGSGKGVRMAYAIGFITGLTQAFNKQSVALMIVTPQDVHDAMDKLRKEGDMTEKCVDTSFKPTRAAMNARIKGLRDGEEFVGKKKVTKG